MSSTAVSRHELERIRNTLIHAANLLLIDSVIGISPLPVKLVSILARLPELLDKTWRLVRALEVADSSYFESENRIIAGLEAARLGPVELFALAAGPIIRAREETVLVRRTSVFYRTSSAANVTELAERLAALGAKETPTIRIDQFVERGSKQFVVYIPGTKKVLGGPMDMRTNLLEISGQRSSMLRAVQLALQKSGATKNDRVIVIGHSQGGMVAMSLAQASQRATVPYRVDKVVAIAAPIGAQPELVNTRVLNLEGTGDLVPLVDGLKDPSWCNLRVVQIHQPDWNPVNNHLIENYVETFRDDYSKADWQDFAQLLPAQGKTELYEVGTTYRGA